MANIILLLSVSVDGFMAGPEGELDWQIVDEELHSHFNAVLRGAGGFLEGRVTHELMAGYWPTADRDPASTPPEVEFAGIWRDTPKFVFSRTLERADWQTTVVREVVPSHIQALKAEARADLFLGGADLAVSFMRHDLVDEYQLYVHPIILGEGKPLFPRPGFRSRLRLAETRTFGSGVVLLRYLRA